MLPLDAHNILTIILKQHSHRLLKSILIIKIIIFKPMIDTLGNCNAYSMTHDEMAVYSQRRNDC